MKSIKKLKILVVIVAIMLAISFMLPMGYSPLLKIGIYVTSHLVNRCQERLLCKTDHKFLLDACRELSRRVSEGDLKPGVYYLRGTPRRKEIAHFPQSIFDLAPSKVILDPDGRVVLGFGGGFVNIGVFAYPEDYKEPYHNFVYGDKKIIDGLWYHDAEYDGNTEYQKRIEALIQKGKQTCGDK